MRLRQDLGRIMSLILDGVLSLAVILACIVTINASPQKESPSIFDKDKSEITKQMLKKVLTFAKVKEADAGASDSHTLRRTKGGIVVSRENINPEWLPTISGITLVVLTPQAIQTKADLEGDFMYLVFTRFATRGPNIMLTLCRIWAQAKDSNLIHLSGGCDTYEYKKVSGKWIGRFVEGWAS